MERWGLEKMKRAARRSRARRGDQCGARRALRADREARRGIRRARAAARERHRPEARLDAAASRAISRTKPRPQEWVGDESEQLHRALRAAKTTARSEAVGRGESAAAKAHRAVSRAARRRQRLRAARAGASRTRRDRRRSWRCSTKSPTLCADAPDAFARLIELAAARKDWRAVLANAERFAAVNPLVPAPHRSAAEAREALGEKPAAIAATARCSGSTRRIPPRFTTASRACSTPAATPPRNAKCCSRSKKPRASAPRSTCCSRSTRANLRASPAKPMTNLRDTRSRCIAPRLAVCALAQAWPPGAAQIRPQQPGQPISARDFAALRGDAAVEKPAPVSRRTSSPSSASATSHRRRTAAPRRLAAVGHGLPRRRPEFLLPAPADDFDEGRSRRPSVSKSPTRSFSAIRSSTSSSRAISSSPTRRFPSSAATCSMAAS